MSTLPIHALALIAFMLASPVAATADEPVTTRAEETARAERLFRERFAWEMNEFPERAMRRGDYTNAHRITDRSLAAIERRHEETLAHHRVAMEIDAKRLAPDVRLSLELFRLRLENTIADHRFRMFLAPMGQRSGPHQTIAQMAERVRFRTAKDYESYLTRLEQLPAYADDAIELMRLGADEGRTPPRIVLAGVADQFDALLADGGLEALAEPFEHLPKNLKAMQRETLPKRLELESMPAARAAMEKLRRFFVEEYLARTRETIAATALPDGEAFYAHQLRKMTTTELTANEIHALGVREVARIRAEMMEVIGRSDFLERFPEKDGLEGEELFRAFVEYLRTDSRFYHDDPEALLAGYRDICKKVDGHLPRFFRTLPRLPYGVRKIPDFMAPQQTTAYYSHGDIENGEPGYFYANTYALDQRPKYEMIALAMHEAVPGHHLQSALAREMENVPKFRTETWFTAYGEGWALYSERLGLEMDLYDDPYDDFGRLLYEMWRACRLVVDPGMHAMGWTRDEAIAFMRENTALSELNIVTEIDRYIAWPGQACAYKIGELEIRRLRTEAEERLGRSFDLRAFHDVVLEAGSVPLSVLETRVRKWIKSHPAGASYD